MTRYANNAGSFHIEPAPSQPQLAHCHGFFIRHEMRRRGHGHILKEQQTRTLEQLGYDYAICTVDGQNQAQITILAQAGWRKLDDFYNSKTGGTTQLWGRNIRNGGAA